MARKKVPASPIPEKDYIRFKARLEELSVEFPERNLMIFYIGVATGYRTQDIVDLTISQLKEALEDEEFYIQEKKQYREYLTHLKNNPNSNKKIPDKRKAPIKPKLKRLLKDYVKGKRKSEYAFPSRNGKGNKHITQKSYSDILKMVGEDLELKHISGHSMRKTYAHRLWERTKDIEYVRIALGHKNIETTKRYLSLDDEVKEDAAEIADDRL
ncbi:tyrosine-type recombinase/integrase [Clostridium chauvoei]|uniref:Tyrosine-type recombinase/integrase n=2 Tax=Clostridium chauvoei TaxID=46867 RepID=A0ABD4RIR1_9CLOT|nr:tyrosine-type recombinase/integrase [Clostridium chauvoei]ATD55420.1 integrase [Clostridium chauvoei]ATD56908.1 integrase [Clostridium chauvoei]MBX7280749.1 tyrosine-type recombinase/integrase [Clostridium chauvoei]MBX7283232.1 tyrosine-type recombinase/integrase [Clostridium chauvoei]MBX7285883.1 tyrosine-type recombinase/integrase [Clostridium chauvoei]